MKSNKASDKLTDKQKISLLNSRVKELTRENELLEELNTATGALLVAANVYENAIHEISRIKASLKQVNKTEEDKYIKEQNLKINKKK